MKTPPECNRVIDHGTQQCRGSGEIIAVVKQRMLDRLANIGVGGEMHQGAWPIFFKHHANLLLIGNFALLEWTPFDRPQIAT